MSQTPALYMSDKAIAAELDELAKKWDELRFSGCALGGGSPGEWMMERASELSYEQNRRRSGGARQTEIPEQSK